MKKLILFLTLVMMLALLGCQSEVQQVSVGHMTLVIPSDWHSLSDETDITSDIDEEMEPYIRMDIYGPETADDETYSLIMFCEDIRGYHKSIESPYFYEPNPDYYWGYSKDQYTIASLMVLASYLSTAEPRSMEDPVTLMINDCEAIEMQSVFLLNDVPFVVNMITFLSENDWGWLTLVRPEASDQYDWSVIRDSVLFK
jgi:hypothetical protein